MMASACCFSLKILTAALKTIIHCLNHSFSRGLKLLDCCLSYSHLLRRFCKDIDIWSFLLILVSLWLSLAHIWHMRAYKHDTASNHKHFQVRLSLCIFISETGHIALSAYKQMRPVVMVLFSLCFLRYAKNLEN